MTSQAAVFHALLRPSILQILRATGYHSAKPSVVDSLTDIAARYLLLLAENTALHAVHNHGQAGDCNVVDVRLALQDAGAILPERTVSEQYFLGEEDVRGVEEFIAWFGGPKMKELMEIGSGDGESDATDYLNALKMKHSKLGDDSKYTGTMIGRPLDTVAEVQVEGGSVTSINEWIRLRSHFPPEDKGDGNDASSPTVSSGLSSVGSRLGDEDMDLS